MQATILLDAQLYSREEINKASFNTGKDVLTLSTYRMTNTFIFKNPF